MLWALVWTVLAVAALVALGLLVRYDVKALLALLREVTAASEQLARVSAVTGGHAGTVDASEIAGAHLPAALGGLRAAEVELRRYLDGPIGARSARSAEDGSTMLQQRPPQEV